MLTNSVQHLAMMENLPLINNNDYLWFVVCQNILFVAALVSNQWEIAIFTCRLSTKCHNSEIFSNFFTENLECFHIFHQMESAFAFSTTDSEVLIVTLWHDGPLGKWLGALVRGVIGST